MNSMKKKTALLLLTGIMSVTALAQPASRIDALTQEKREATRTMILQAELKQEQSLRDSAQQELVTSKAGADIAAIKTAVQQHQHNMEAIERELKGNNGLPLNAPAVIKPSTVEEKPAADVKRAWDVYAR